MLDINLSNQDDNSEKIISDKKDDEGEKIILDKRGNNDGEIMLDRKGDDSEGIISDKEDNTAEEIVPNKNGGGNFLNTSLAMVLMILIFSIVSVASYLPIRNIYFPVKDNVKKYVESSGINSMAFDIANLTKRLQRYVNRSNDWSDDRYINIGSVKYKIYPLEKGENSEQILENNISEGGEEIGAGRNPEDETTAEIITETTTETDTETAGGEVNEEMVGETEGGIAVQRRTLTNMQYISDAELQAEIDDSLLYIKITFDGSGHPAIEAVLGEKLGKKGTKFNKDLIINYLDDGDMEKYAGLEATYIIPQDFESYNDAFTSGMKEDNVFPGYMVLILIIGAVSILVLIIAAFAIPYSLQNKTAICRGFNKMPLELKLFAWVLLVGLCGINVAVLDSHSYGYINLVTKIVYDVNPYFYIIGIPITFILYLLVYLGAVYIKYIYHMGFKEGFIDNCLLARVLLSFIRNTKKIFKRVMAIDLREDNQRKLIGIAVMNFLVIVILGSGGSVGFILAVIYSIIVFKYILGLIENAAELNQASAQVAGGNFDIKVDEDMGILTPMAQNLNNIKQGFSVAVDKEIKSERMKSELISNVSHDLKTPLTSIITYVDLLKNEGVESDTQKEYIDIIDKKSQRLRILIEDLFEASKATSGNIDFNLENIDVVALFRQTLGELEEKINESNLQFKINAPENKVMCNLDGRRTYRIFANIISNILKYSMQDSRVYIDVIEGEQKIDFIFRNISAHEMNFDPSEIAERFSRGDESRSTEGSGLGLSIAKSFVELQGGTLDIIIDGDLFKLTVAFPKI
ncbi:MAG TPA: HAMP domain-containing sensor histidine kinase [Clostridia bacterium]|nr:HAMP domain-containing sensor histidine kinase [Clostridia bacterium]